MRKPQLLRMCVRTCAWVMQHLLKEYGILEEGFILHMVGSLIAGLTATTLCAPADLVKVRVLLMVYFLTTSSSLLPNSYILLCSSGDLDTRNERWSQFHREETLQRQSRLCD